MRAAAAALALAAGPAAAEAPPAWEAARAACVAAVLREAPFEARGLEPAGAGLWRRGNALSARLGTDAGLRRCEVRAAVAPGVGEALGAFLDWADAGVAAGEWRYGDASRERRVVPVAARVVSAAPSARGCAVEAVLLADPHSGHVSLTVAETGGAGCPGGR